MKRVRMPCGWRPQRVTEFLVVSDDGIGVAKLRGDAPKWLRKVCPCGHAVKAMGTEDENVWVCRGKI